VKTEPFGPLDPALYREIVRRALAEDLGWGDLTTEAAVPADARAHARLVAGVPCVVAGLDLAEETFRQLDPRARMTRHRHDGEACGSGTAVATVEGRAAPLATAERTALNFLSRLSATATATRRFVDLSRGRVLVLDTRATTPLLRTLEQYAVRAGGGTNHRQALDEGPLVESKHVRLAGGVRPAFERVTRAVNDMPVEVEVRSLDELDEALDAGVPRLLVTEVFGGDLAEAVRRTRGRAQVEYSGAVTPGSFEAIVATGVDFVSIPALTASPGAIDFRLEFELAG
jgi:nicotinate-nucleotide pyrophosphorylase (carboxylating)